MTCVSLPVSWSLLCLCLLLLLLLLLLCFRFPLNLSPSSDSAAVFPCAQLFQGTAMGSGTGTGVGARAAAAVATAAATAAAAGPAGVVWGPVCQWSGDGKTVSMTAVASVQPWSTLALRANAVQASCGGGFGFSAAECASFDYSAPISVSVRLPADPAVPRVVFAAPQVRSHAPTNVTH